jgi:hypothetical protein
MCPITRPEKSGPCVKSDDVFSFSEQHYPLVETDALAQRAEVRAGHVEVVDDKRVAPTKLIAVLQGLGVLYPTSPERLSAFNQLLARIYQDDTLLYRDASQRFPS